MLRTIAWTGGVLFEVALAYGVYFYAVVLARVAPPETPLFESALVNAALFSIFALHHSALARTGVKRLLTRIVPPAAERTLYVWIASLLWIGLCASWRLLPGVAYQVGGVGRWGLYGVQLMGVILTLRGARAIDPLELAGIRQAAGDTRTGDLRIVGPFRFVRHPIYLGWLLMVLGAPLMTMNRLVFALVSSTYLIVAIPWEERSLVGAFGDRYRAYQRQVRWRLLPGVW